MNRLEETPSISVDQKVDEKVAVNLKHFCVVTNEPEEFVEKLERLCQEHCDSSGDYFFNFVFSE